MKRASGRQAVNSKISLIESYYFRDGQVFGQTYQSGVRIIHWKIRVFFH